MTLTKQEQSVIDWIGGEEDRLVTELQRDYTEAMKLHVPDYRGGPNLPILLELIRMG